MKTSYYTLAELVGTELSAAQVRRALADVQSLIRSLAESELAQTRIEAGLRAVAEQQSVTYEQLARRLGVVLRASRTEENPSALVARLGKDRTLRLLAKGIRSLTDRA